MIIDSHGHIVAPSEVYHYQAVLLASRAYPVSAPPKISDDLLESSLQGHMKLMDEVGTDMQIISPRPFHMMHSIKPDYVVQKWTSFYNDMIHRQVKLRPDRLLGMCGLPQSPGIDIKECLPELERCVKELGFVGALLNPDPMEGNHPAAPGLGDEYWYPLYEKMVELDVPALVHPASCCSPRQSYTLHFLNEESIAIMSLLESKVFEDFPDLKIIISHSGGAIPYHMGRFRAWRYRTEGAEDFDVSIKRLFFDTCNYSQESLELLFKVIGSDNVVFGTEKPGTGSARDPKTGRMMDDLKPVIENIDFLSEADRKKIFENNAKKLFNLKL
jgi:4-oxalmesaconate hydratase